MTAPIITFHPPYLRYDNPSELSQIQDQFETLREMALADQRASGMSPATQADTPILATLTPVEAPKIVPGRITGTARRQAANASAIPKTEGKTVAENTAGRLDSENARVSALFEVTTAPSGIVSLGFNCRATFHASNNFHASHTIWSIYFYDPKDNNFTVAGQYLGATYFPKNDPSQINFEVDFSTYATDAYMLSNGKALFVIQCNPVATLGLGSKMSHEVVLDFNAPPCVDLYSVTLNENTFYGSENGNDPEMTVVLDAPAPPGGQRIYLSVSNTSKAGILGNNFFDIPAGQTTGTISGFLGTEKVLQDQAFDILVTAGGAITGHATVYLHKKDLKFF
jgi:hypothetical protein